MRRSRRLRAQDVKQQPQRVPGDCAAGHQIPHCLMRHYQAEVGLRHVSQAAGRGRAAEEPPVQTLGIVQRTLSRIGKAIQDCASQILCSLLTMRGVS